MILEDEGRAICRYNVNEVLPNVEGVAIGTQEYMANRKELHDHDIHHALLVNLVEHVYRAHIQSQTEYQHNICLTNQMKIQICSSRTWERIQLTMTRTTIMSDIFYFSNSDIM
ncbi:unnamed protein product [Lactuca saligna]|uniref:Uncharacterized protein n=1 Tax=Lactuca saligna TaxID=75948 RepID=A0AA35Y618_LACSI|nr:unnamed protein product [Lactuca saligna]